MHTITVRIEFDAAHRLLNHNGKCRHIHGHHYVAEVTLASGWANKHPADELDKLGMIADFAQVKILLKDWIDTKWDHNILLHEYDPFVGVLNHLSIQPIERIDPADKKRETVGPLSKIPAASISFSTQTITPELLTGGRTPYLFNINPTAEVMAGTLFHVAKRMLSHQVKAVVKSVSIYETPSCRAEYSVEVSR